jgi:hypothetical protein
MPTNAAPATPTKVGLSAPADADQRLDHDHQHRGRCYQRAFTTANAAAERVRRLSASMTSRPAGRTGCRPAPAARRHQPAEIGGELRASGPGSTQKLSACRKRPPRSTLLVDHDTMLIAICLPGRRS